MIDAASPRTLHVKGDMDPRLGGSVSATLSCARLAQHGGDKATILSTSVSGAHAAAPDVNLGNVRQVFCRRHFPKKYCFSLPLLWWLIRHLKQFDLVEVHEVWTMPAFATWLASRARRVPFVIHPHGSLDPYDLKKHARAKRMLAPVVRRMLSQAQCLWMTSDLEAARVETYGASVKRYVTPLPVPAPTSPGSRARFRGRLALGDDARIILFLGRIDPNKGLESLVSAFAEVHRANPDCVLVIAGSGEAVYETEFRSFVARCPASDHILMPGFLLGLERADAFAGADLFCLYSDYESFGLATLEAMGHGLPAVLSNTVHIGADLARTGAAVLVSRTDDLALAAVLARLVQDRQQLASMRTAALLTAVGYRPDELHAAYAQVRREVLAGLEGS